MITRLYLVFVAIVAVLVIYASHGRDLGQWKAVNNDPAVSQWYRSLTMPDSGGSYSATSCCGDADAYWCDDITVKDGHVFCSITDTREDGPLGRPHRPIGEVHEIPAEKMKFSKTDPQPNLGNPTGHAIIFLSAAGYTYCFVPNGGV